jgi:hypothetical protein
VPAHVAIPQCGFDASNKYLHNCMQELALSAKRRARHASTRARKSVSTLTHRRENGQSREQGPGAKENTLGR